MQWREEKETELKLDNFSLDLGEPIIYADKTMPIKCCNAKLWHSFGIDYFAGIVCSEKAFYKKKFPFFDF